MKQQKQNPRFGFCSDQNFYTSSVWHCILHFLLYQARKWLPCIIFSVLSKVGQQALFLCLKAFFERPLSWKQEASLVEMRWACSSNTTALGMVFTDFGNYYHRYTHHILTYLSFFFIFQLPINLFNCKTLQIPITLF